METKLLERQLMTARWATGDITRFPVHRKYIMSREERIWQRKRWVENNRDLVNEIARRHAKKNRGKKAIYQKLWRERNKEQQRAYFQRYYLMNRIRKLREAIVRRIKSLGVRQAGRN